MRDVSVALSLSALIRVGGWSGSDSNSDSDADKTSDETWDDALVSCVEPE